MEIKFINTSLSYIMEFIKPIHTTEYNEHVKFDLPRHLHRVTFHGETESVIIDFTAKSADIIPLWMQYHFSDEKRKLLRESLSSEMVALRSRAETHLRSNIERLRSQFTKDNCFGDEYFLLDMDNILNPDLRFEIEIQDISVLNSDKEPIYRKSGVCLDSERAMIISEYRHVLEWSSNENKIKLINLGIFSGQKHSSQSIRYIVFELNYREDGSYFVLGDRVKDKDIDLRKWYAFATQVIEDTDIKNKVYSILKQGVQR
ncbi:hypothetical protein [Cohnella sp. AR92]|uniref:hypothetical protein n=1 Tax=Cohnella sp. AR92 TaxID=648716 RepID=UPI000F8EB130|nr:hypothetical protein [Cohnella sp. AR92]RUS44590.1 hypothetical protein ELR57_22670 [Cohnella sp. AR92]